MTATAHVYYDTQDPNNTGWAYRLYRDGSEVESGECCDELDDDATLPEIAESAALQLCEDEIEITVYQHERPALRWRGADDWRHL